MCSALHAVAVHALALHVLALHALALHVLALRGLALHVWMGPWLTGNLLCHRSTGIYSRLTLNEVCFAVVKRMGVDAGGRAGLVPITTPTYRETDFSL